MRHLSAALAGAFVLLAANAAFAKDENPPEVAQPGDAKPGVTALVTAPKGMRYFLRVPKGYKAKEGARLVVFLHGSNMNGLTYVRSFEAQRWCDDDILCCPNGEQPGPAGPDPFGVNNFTFGSAPLVADVTEQVQKAFNVQVTYVGGHSQGGFLTYSVILNHPSLYQGALPMAGDCWSQNEPNLWEGDEKALEERKRIPIAIIHGRADPVVQFSQGQHAYDVFRAMGWPGLRLFAPEQLGHQFMLSPVDEALAWLDALNGRAPKESLKLLDDWAKDGEWGSLRAACEALLREHGSAAGVKAAAAKHLKRCEEEAKAASDAMKEALQGEAMVWVPQWLEFWRLHGGTKAAAPLVKRYLKERDDERRDAGRMFGEAMGMFRSDRRAEAYVVLEKLLAEAPHTYEAYYAWKWLSERQ